jgi:hypothetical protein
MSLAEFAIRTQIFLEMTTVPIKLVKPSVYLTLLNASLNAP